MVQENELDRPIVIVSGLPRSGTSMMMQMLDRGGLDVLADGVRVADEDNPRGYYEFEPVKRTKQDDSWLTQAAGKAVKMVHLLLYDLPLDRPYRVVLMRRHMDEVLRSQSTMLIRTGNQGASIPLERLGRIFEQQIQDALAYLKEQPCFEVIEVRYDAVLSNPLAEAEAIHRFLGGELDLQAMATAVEPSLYRQKS